MSEPRKHHFLPQFYLKGFSLDRRGIYLLDKKQGKFFGCQIKDVAAIRDYHQLDVEELTDLYILEKRLATVEDNQAKLIKSLISDGITDSKHRYGLLEFLSIMRMRVPAVKEHIANSYSSMIKEVALRLQTSGKLPPPPPGFEDKLKIENLNIEIANWKCLEKMFALGTNEKTISLLAKMRITLYRAPTKLNFVTSDQPVALYHPTLFNSPYGAGPITPGVEITLPISSQLLLKLDHENGPDIEITATYEDVVEYNRRTLIMTQTFAYTGISPEMTLKDLNKHSKVFAGFVYDDIKTDDEFLQVQRFITVGPKNK